ncbi:S-adenosyl-L-methionine-dependent methyltransferase, partial [Hyaloscypha variabilis F]
LNNSPEENTQELDDSFSETVEYHNRTYQQYAINNHMYFEPTDMDERWRLYLLYHVQDMVFNRLIFPPLTRPRRILDCGSGVGLWAFQAAVEHPRCEVIGIDINPIVMPRMVPKNVFFQVADLNDTFKFPADIFDLVNSQMMVSSIHANRWTQYLREIFRVTREGGWCQMTEIYHNIQSDNGSLTEGPMGIKLTSYSESDNALSQWSSRYHESLEGLRDFHVPIRLPNMLRAAGFVDVESRTIQLPTCGWPTEQRDRAIGNLNRENVQNMLSSLVLYPFTKRLGMTIQDTQLLVAQARIEADNPAFKV